MKELIQDAFDMLNDISKEQAHLMYQTLILDEEARAAFILAYRMKYMSENL